MLKIKNNAFATILILGILPNFTIMFIIDEHIDNFKNSSNLSIVFDRIFYATMACFIYNCLKKMSNIYKLKYLQKN